MRIRDVEALLDDTLGPKDPPGLATYTGRRQSTEDQVLNGGDVVEVRGLHGQSPYVWVRKPGDRLHFVVNAHQLAPAETDRG